jgi:hypothetical protein
VTSELAARDLELPPAQVADLLQVLSKALRANQLYLPNNPVYQKAVANVQAAFQKLWEGTAELVLDVGEVELTWEGNEVYRQDQKHESIAWTLFKDGVRSLTFRMGAEEAEVVRFLSVINRARALPPEAPDDLLTLLWAEDFKFIAYTFRELAADMVAPLEVEEAETGVPASAVRETVQEEAPAPSQLAVSLEEFDSTLYFLDDREIEYLHREVEREYSQDLRRNVLAMLFDLLELQTYSTVRSELISIVENFIPYLLGAADFRSVAFILREIKVVLSRARDLLPEHRVALRDLPTRLSDPDALSQLLQSLDEAAVHPAEDDLGDLFAELQPEALATLAGWLSRLSSDRVRRLVRSAAERLAQANPAEVLKALERDDHTTQLETVRLAGRLRLLAATEAVGQLLETGDRTIKLAVAEALMAIASPSAIRFLERGIDDSERDVRVTCVKFLGFRGHRNAFPRIEAAVVGGKLRGADLTEKIAFFEAYGALAGAVGIAPLERMLLGRGGLLARREDPQTRACAAMALGKIRMPEARAVLEQALQDKEALVRNAVGRALREVGP